MEQENINTFNKKIEEFGRSEYVNNLRNYFNITGSGTIEWKKNVTIKVKNHVEYLANTYLK